MATSVLSPAKLKKVLEALEENWQAEVEAHHTYLALAERDTDSVRAQVLRLNGKRFAMKKMAGVSPAQIQ